MQDAIASNTMIPEKTRTAMPNNQKPPRGDGHAEQHRALAESATDEAERFRRLAEEAREVRDQHREALETMRQEREHLR